MKECNYCGQKFEPKKGFQNYCSNRCKGISKIDWELRSQLAVDSNAKRYGILKQFKVKCKTCRKTFFIEERERKFPRKEKYFCSRSCANTRKHTEETKKKISKSAKTSEKVLSANRSRERNLKIIVCRHCKKKFKVRFNSNPKYCCRNCYLKDPHKSKNFKKKIGGYRNGSGRGRSGWYKGYWCDSSWELAWVVYNIDHGIKFERNTEKFDYLFKDKRYKFIPDFKLENDIFVEIKGYYSDRWEAKLRQFLYKIEVLYAEEIKKYLDYSIDKYGKNFVELYEDSEKYSKKENV